MTIDGASKTRIWEEYGRSWISPDGKWIEIGANQRSVIIPSSGGELFKTFDMDPDRGQPAGWTSDGTALLWIKSVNGVANVWQTNTDGGEAKQLTSFDSEMIWNVAMSRDGKNLAVARHSATGDVVLIRDLAR